MSRFPFTLEDGYSRLSPAASRFSDHPIITFLSLQRRFFLILLVLFASLFSYFTLFSSSSPSSPPYDPTATSPPLDTPAQRLLYAPPEGTCAFEPPTHGLSPRERALLVGGTTPKGARDWLGYRDIQGEGEGKVVHPLLGLLREGESQFEEMVGRRSETREQAVREYRRRYGRKPPRGWDKWWDYVSEHNVLLPDEYDEIERSLGPFRAFTKEDLAARIAKSRGIQATVDLIVKNGVASVVYEEGRSLNGYWEHRRSDAQLELIQPIAHHLPDFTIAFGLKDEPQFMFDHEVRDKLLDLGAKGKKLETAEFIASPPARFPWARSCSLSSPLRSGLVEQSSHSAFIQHPRSAQDVCYHPLIAEGHGFMLDQKGEWTDPAPKFMQTTDEVWGPVMALSKTGRNGDVLGVAYDAEDFKSKVEDNVPWSQKKEKLYWRGHATGMEKSLSHGMNWRLSHRPRLHQQTNSEATYPLVPVLLADPETSLAETHWFQPKELKQWGYDIGLSGKAIQCSDGDGTCKEMADVLKFKAEEPGTNVHKYKYIYDIDGNAWTSRFQRLMITKSLVFKATIFPEWNFDILPAWFAYVPMKMDYTDIPSVLAFFRGSPPPSTHSSQTHAHAASFNRDEVARRIGANGACWVQRTWRKEDLTAYVWRLYLEWARIERGGEGDYEE